MEEKVRKLRTEDIALPAEEAEKFKVKVPELYIRVDVDALIRACSDVLLVFEGKTYKLPFDKFKEALMDMIKMAEVMNR